MLSNFICIYDNKTYQKGKIIQKVKWGMVYTGQISASEKAKPPPPKKTYFTATGEHIYNF